MNLEFDERRHLPRYPEEKLIEKQLETRHDYVPETKQAKANDKVILSESKDKKKQQS